MSKVIIPYRGDRTTARLQYKKMEKQQLRKWKRKLLKVWDLKPVTLWDSGYGGYVNDDVREALGIEEDFLTSTKNLTWFGVQLNAEVDADKIINLNETDKDYLRDKCLDVFAKYGKTVKVAYYDSDSYDYKIFKNGLETDFENEEDEQLATLLYSRLIMYMVDNDSTDTMDKWSDINPGDFDYWTSFERTEERQAGFETYRVSTDARSQLKYFTYTFTNDDILKVINDRLFVKRNYQIVAPSKGIFYSEDDGSVYAKTIDRDLINELLDNSDYEAQVLNSEYTFWNGTSYEIDYEAVKQLPPKDFMLFIQSHLGTYHKSKKKWYQSGLFGFLMIIVVVTIAILSQQYWLIGVSLGTTLIVAGMVLSVGGALLGNEVMMIGGQFVSLAGGAISIAETYVAQEAMIAEMSQAMAKTGMEQVAINTAISQATDQLLLDTLMQTAKLGLSAYNSFGSQGAESMSEAITPAEELQKIFVAENNQWDFVNRMMPEYIIASTMKIM